MPLIEDDVGSPVADRLICQFTNPDPCRFRACPTRGRAGLSHPDADARRKEASPDEAGKRDAITDVKAGYGEERDKKSRWIATLPQTLDRNRCETVDPFGVRRLRGERVSREFQECPETDLWS